jgi:hypothetical protein
MATRLIHNAQRLQQTLEEFTSISTAISDSKMEEWAIMVDNFQRDPKRAPDPYHETLASKSTASRFLCYLAELRHS